MAGTRGLFCAVDSMEHAVVCEIPETDGGEQGRFVLDLNWQRLKYRHRSHGKRLADDLILMNLLAKEHHLYRPVEGYSRA